MSALPRRIEATAAAAGANRLLERYASALARAWNGLREITHALHAIDDADAVLANASAYLEAFGHVVVAWLWLDQALVAQAAMGAAQGDERDFYRGKLAGCEYFYSWELPKIPGWLAVLQPPDRTLRDTPESAI